VPGLLDRYLARRARESQVTDDLPPGHPRRHVQDNVDSPIVGDFGAHGPFDERARDFSSKLWLRMHAGWLVLAAVAVAAAAGVISLWTL
jgi:hypothetical protein